MSLRTMSRAKRNEIFLIITRPGEDQYRDPDASEYPGQQGCIPQHGGRVAIQPLDHRRADDKSCSDNSSIGTAIGTGYGITDIFQFTRLPFHLQFAVLRAFQYVMQKRG